MILLRPYQKEGALAIREFGGRALLADEMGLGKSAQALYWISKIPNHRPAIIVCPASLKWTWQYEADHHFGMRVEVIQGRRKPRHRDIPADIVAINYDLLGSWLPVLIAAEPKIIIFDEVHFIKNLTAQRTQAALKLAEVATSVVGLSGTPFTNRPSELWAPLQAIKPNLFPSFQKYAWRYCKPRFSTRFGWMYEGATRKEELHSILKENVMIRRLKKDVAKDLPDKIFKTVGAPLDHFKEYFTAQQDFIGWLKGISQSRANKAKRNLALTKVGYLLRLIAKCKLPFTVQWLRDFHESHPEKKLVGMTMHTFVIDHLLEKFPRALFIDGRVMGIKRSETVRRFQTNPKDWLFIGNYMAAGTGITLTAAHNFVGFDFPWTPADLNQAGNRIHRIGQAETCMYHYLVALKTVEEKQIKMLQGKSSVFSSIIDGDKGNDVDFLSELLKELKGNK